MTHASLATAGSGPHDVGGLDTTNAALRKLHDADMLHTLYVSERGGGAREDYAAWLLGLRGAPPEATRGRVGALLAQLRALDTRVPPVVGRYGCHGGHGEACKWLQRLAYGTRGTLPPSAPQYNAVPILAGYASERKGPDVDLTSRLSAYLHFGHISPLEVAAHVAHGDRHSSLLRMEATKSGGGAGGGTSSSGGAPVSDSAGGGDGVDGAFPWDVRAYEAALDSCVPLERCADPLATCPIAAALGLRAPLAGAPTPAPGDASSSIGHKRPRADAETATGGATPSAHESSEVFMIEDADDGDVDASPAKRRAVRDDGADVADGGGGSGSGGGDGSVAVVPASALRLRVVPIAPSPISASDRAKFLDELCVWREMAVNFVLHRPTVYDS